MGGNSTSHSAVLTDKKTQSSGAFDLQSWQGLTELLKVGKETLHDTAEYAAFRNLVLQYAQHGGDVELKQKILAVVRSFNNVPTQDTVPAPRATAPAEVSLSQNSEPRLLPHIETPVTVQKSESAQPAPTRRLLPRFEENIRRVNRNNVPPVQKTNTQSTAPVQNPAVAQPIIPEVTQVEPKREEIASIVTIPEVPSSPEVAVATPSLGNHKERIAEIKNSVHSLFGNPAALMNLHNGAGQTYMKALLMAMKAIGPGSDENADMRMAELEKAYKALTDENKDAHEAIPTEPEAKETVIAQPEPIQEIKLSPIEDVIAPEVSVPEEIAPVSLPDEIITAEEDAEEQKSEIKYSAKHTLEQLSSRASQLRKSEFVPHDTEPDLTVTNSAAPYTTPSSPSEAPVAYGDLRKANTPYSNTADRPSMTEISTKQSELVSEEISSALKKLLHDWTIFEGSGLFGIGPGGIDHPLYQKLAPLSMGEVIAGRWEKSDPKITKTIKEYVDAWRHEQGIAYTINETFEHYLRRVIQRILKRQSA